MRGRIDVILVDDHRIVIDGLKASIFQNNDLRLVGEAHSGKELFLLLKNHRPDVLVLDLVLPDISGAEIIKKIQEEGIRTNVLIYTGNTPDSLLLETLENGAMGLVFKDASLTDLERAIRRVAAGETYFGEHLKSDLIAALIRKTRVGRIPGRNDGKKLSAREIEIIRLLCRGLPTKEIACDLHISANTVETHKKNILNKLQLATIIDLLKYAIKNEIISL